MGIVAAAKHLHSVLCEAGVTSVYVEYADTEHGFDLICPLSSPVAQSATYDTERFLALMGVVCRLEQLPPVWENVKTDKGSAAMFSSFIYPCLGWAIPRITCSQQFAAIHSC